jgi:hypothetical protein
LIKNNLIRAAKQMQEKPLISQAPARRPALQSSSLPEYYTAT